MDFFKNLFKGKKTIDSIKEDIELENNEYIDTFKNNINIILSDLLVPILNKNNKKHTFQTLSLLENPTNCNKLTLFLSKNINQNFKKIELSRLAEEIFFSKNKSKNCESDTCERLDDEKYKIDNKVFTKRTLCKIISRHYIKHLNLIAAIVSAVNPSNNMCLIRLKKLLEVLKTNEKKGVIKVCVKDAVYNGALINQPGMKQLLDLYYFHLIQISETKNELSEDYITSINNEYTKLVQLFSDIVMDKDERSSQVIKDINIMKQKKQKKHINALLNDNDDKSKNIHIKPEIIKISNISDNNANTTTNNNSNNNNDINNSNDVNNDVDNDVDNDLDNDVDNINTKPNKEFLERQFREEKREKEKIMKDNMKKRDEYKTKQILNKQLKRESILDRDKKPNENINNLSSNLAHQIKRVSNNIKHTNWKRNRDKRNKFKYYKGGKRKTIKKKKRKSIKKKSKVNKKKLKNALNKYIDNRKYRNITKSTIDGQKIKHIKNIDIRKMDLNKLVENFKNYVNSVGANKYYKKLIPIINKSFRSYDREKINEICENSRNDKIVVNLESKLIKKYLENYETLKNIYLDNSVILLDILEKELLIKDNSTNTNNDNGSEIFRLNTLSTEKLQDLEYRIRDKISNLYYDCQMKYVEGVQLLDEYFIKKEQLEM